MGKTSTIKDKEKQDAEFRSFMEKLGTESKADEDKLLAEIRTLVDEHYESNGWDHARLFGERRSDYQNYSDWGLDRVNAIIKSIGDALAAGDYPSSKVPGSDEASKSTIEEAKKFKGIFAGDYSLIVARVQALISGALSQFSIRSEVTRKSELRDLPLSGGLHLFFASSGKVYKENRFFSNQFIGAFQIVFEAYVSADEAKYVGIQLILATTEQELAILNDLIITIRQQQATSLKEILKNDIKDYQSTKAAYDLALDDTKADRDKVIEQYNKYKTVTDTVDRLFDELDLTEFGVAAAASEALQIDHLFNPWEAALARRHIRERLAA